ncbi:glutamate synthase subunit beta [Bacillus sp. AFS076308]|uniref:glutamate synthase subunit beta n=1 Tax=Bacillus sp. AFS076308 TaxID=2033512 RepID=UPI000BF89809|nr:glutamate synthase subunit beta [Bacillus sp. AFS076308]PFN96085.1 glutamate synthase subunit beta [Bacillus sp. AFS076308]
MKREKAIIIGGGMAGKLIAAAISPYFHNVQILEKDPQPENKDTVRKGVPQAHHIHALLHAGDHALERLFPGFQKDMVERGSIKIDSLWDLAWFHHGVWKLRFKSGDTTLLQTRPLLETYVEERVNQIANITYIYGTKVQSFLLADDQSKVYGVEVLQGNKTKTLIGDLVIDTSGSVSFTKEWLEKQGRTVPEEKVDIGLCYATRKFTLPEPPNDFKIKIIYPNPPKETIGGTLSIVENNQCIVTLNGYLNTLNPAKVKDAQGFINKTAMLPLPDIYQELQKGTTESETAIYQFPQIMWRHFERVNLPAGLLVAGDSLCRIDPVFGQGMSIAALEALAIRDYIASTSPSGQIKKLQKQLAKIIAPAWLMVLCEDFRFDEVKGKKPIGLKFLQWYVKKIFLLSAKKKSIYKDLVKVTNLVSPATILFKPTTILEVLKHKKDHVEKVDS